MLMNMAISLLSASKALILCTSMMCVEYLIALASLFFISPAA